MTLPFKKILFNHHQAVIYPWEVEMLVQVFGDQMFFLDVNQLRLGKRRWNLATSSVAVEFRLRTLCHCDIHCYNTVDCNNNTSPLQKYGFNANNYLTVTLSGGLCSKRSKLQFDSFFRVGHIVSYVHSTYECSSPFGVIGFSGCKMPHMA